MQTSTEALRTFDAGNAPAVDEREGNIDLIDTIEACAILGGTKPVHRATLWRMVKAGKLPPPNRLKRWERREFVAAVRRYIEGGQEPCPNEGRTPAEVRRF